MSVSADNSIINYIIFDSNNQRYMLPRAGTLAEECIQGAELRAAPLKRIQRIIAYLSVVAGIVGMYRNGIGLVSTLALGAISVCTYFLGQDQGIVAKKLAEKRVTWIVEQGGSWDEFEEVDRQACEGRFCLSIKANFPPRAPSRTGQELV